MLLCLVDHFESDIVLTPNQDSLIKHEESEEESLRSGRVKRDASRNMKRWNEYPSGDGFIVYYHLNSNYSK